MERERRAAFLALKETETEKTWSNLALAENLRGSGGSGAFARELVYGVLRNRMLLDFNIAGFLKKPGLKTAEKILLRMGFYQLCFMDGVGDHAAVNETVALAKSFAKGREGFVNAVLRSFIRSGKSLVFPPLSEDPTSEELIEYLSVRYSASPWIVELWLKAYGREKAEELLRASLTPAPMCLRANRLKISAEELAEKLRSLGFEAEKGKNAPCSVIAKGSGLLSGELYKQGFFSVQGEASQLAVSLLDPREGQLMLDLCAAPGGKSCAAAEQMNDKGAVKAFELHEQRTELIKASAERLGLSSVEAVCADSSVFMPEYEGRADRVLCDVPCSGLGVVRQKPEIKLSERSEDLDRLPDLQRKILDNGLRYLKPGGRLVYSTCTANPAENEQVTEHIKKDPRFVIEREEQIFQTAGGMDGFYICLIRRQDCSA
ncbi:MAG: 16S rRNA (cytosine(967)-C(5))-methyltransferase RsmB [Firmicutes bacterium]|nr:16S rRNA (cytosine(967)-C(5))-methyltransferase RsmB [Bacillota bacterium]